MLKGGIPSLEVLKGMVDRYLIMNAEEYGNDLTTELCSFCPTAFLCTLEVSAMQTVYDDFPPSSYAAYR